MKISGKIFVATRCARAWRVIQASSHLTELKESIRTLVRRSILLNHPFIQLDRGFVFIHVPKAAGTSLRKALRLTAPLDIPAHERAVEVLPFIKTIVPKIISIAFVRNPYTRFVSLYNYARLEESLYHSARNPACAPQGKHPDYDILLNKNLEECAELLVQGKLGHPGVWPSHWQPQIEWLIDHDGKIMVDFIGRVEYLDADLKKLKQRHGIDTEPALRLNQSGGNGNTPQLTDRARDLIRLYYKRDFEMLGYDESRLPQCFAQANPKLVYSVVGDVLGRQVKFVGRGDSKATPKRGNKRSTQLCRAPWAVMPAFRTVSTAAKPSAG